MGKQHTFSIYRPFDPSPDIAHIVHKFVRLIFVAKREKIYTQGMVPIGCPSIIFSINGTIDSDTTPFENKKLPDNHIIGQHTQSCNIISNDIADTFGIIFQPAAFHQLVRVPMHEFAQNAFSIEDVLGQDGFKLIKLMQSETETLEMVKHAEQFIRAKITKFNSLTDVVSLAIRSIAYQPTLPIEEICDSLKVSNRHLRRTFKEKVGIGPKYFLRIKRFHEVLNLAALYPSWDLHDIIYKCGYYDQSHFVNDFKKFTGKTPRNYLICNERHLEIGLA